MADQNEEETEQLFEQALTLAEKHLDMAMEEAGDLADYVAVAMIEVAVNQAIDAAGHQDMITVLRDLADQIEQDAGEDGVLEADNDQ